MDKIKYLCVDKVVTAFYYYWSFFICGGDFVVAQNIFCILCTRIISYSLSGSSVSIANVVKKSSVVITSIENVCEVRVCQVSYVWHIKFSHAIKIKGKLLGYFQILMLWEPKNQVCLSLSKNIE